MVALGILSLIAAAIAAYYAWRTVSLTKAIRDEEVKRRLAEAFYALRGAADSVARELEGGGAPRRDERFDQAQAEVVRATAWGFPEVNPDIAAALSLLVAEMSATTAWRDPLRVSTQADQARELLANPPDDAGAPRQFGAPLRWPELARRLASERLEIMKRNFKG